MRNIIHIIELVYINETKAYVKIATTDTERIPSLIEQNRLWWSREMPFVSWSIKERQYHTLNMSEEQYLASMNNCDVVDDVSEEILLSNEIPIPDIPENIPAEEIPVINDDAINELLREKGLL